MKLGQAKRIIFLCVAVALAAVIIWFNGPAFTADWYRLLHDRNFSFAITMIGCGSLIYLAGP